MSEPAPPPDPNIERFIQLRADGWSFARIAAQLHVSKPTLIKWGREHLFEIQNLAAVETEALADSCLPSRLDRWKQISALLSRIQEEIVRRDLDSVDTAQLISLAARLRAEAAREKRPLRFSDIPSATERYTFSHFLDWEI